MGGTDLRVEPFRPVLDGAALRDLNERLRAARVAPGTGGGWERGTPTAIDVFGGEIVPFAKPPRELAERYFNVTAWAEHGRGGHFPAVAEPQLLAERLRAAFRPHRGPGGRPRAPG